MGLIFTTLWGMIHELSRHSTDKKEVCSTLLNAPDEPEDPVVGRDFTECYDLSLYALLYDNIRVVKS